MVSQLVRFFCFKNSFFSPTLNIINKNASEIKRSVPSAAVSDVKLQECDKNDITYLHDCAYECSANKVMYL